MEEWNLCRRREPARLQLLEMKRNNGDVVATPREEDAPIVRYFVFNHNKAYCLD